MKPEKIEITPQFTESELNDRQDYKFRKNRLLTELAIIAAYDFRLKGIIISQGESAYTQVEIEAITPKKREEEPVIREMPENRQLYTEADLRALMEEG